MPRNVANFHVRRYFNLSLKSLLLRTAAGPIEGHPRRPRGSQSGREKRRDESFQVGAKESFARTWKLSSRLFSRPDWLPLGLRGWLKVELTGVCNAKHCYTKVVKNCRSIFDDNFTTLCSTNSEIKKGRNKPVENSNSTRSRRMKGFDENNHLTILNKQP